MSPTETAFPGITLRPIGIIHSPHTHPDATPVQPIYAEQVSGRAEIYPEFSAGLCDLEGFSHIYLLYQFHRAGSARLSVKPFLDTRERGVFATRAPCRPNPLGMSLVRLVRREGNVLHLLDVDMLDGTPLLDIKPYVARFDARADVRCGWQDQIDEVTARRLGTRQRPQVH